MFCLPQRIPVATTIAINRTMIVIINLNPLFFLLQTYNKEASVFPRSPDQPGFSTYLAVIQNESSYVSKSQLHEGRSLLNDIWWYPGVVYCERGWIDVSSKYRPIWSGYLDVSYEWHLAVIEEIFYLTSYLKALSL